MGVPVCSETLGYTGAFLSEPVERLRRAEVCMAARLDEGAENWNHKRAIIVVSND